MASEGRTNTWMGGRGTGGGRQEVVGGGVGFHNTRTLFAHGHLQMVFYNPIVSGQLWPHLVGCVSRKPLVTYTSERKANRRWFQSPSDHNLHTIWAVHKCSLFVSTVLLHSAQLPHLYPPQCVASHAPTLPCALCQTQHPLLHTSPRVQHGHRQAGRQTWVVTILNLNMKPPCP